MSRQGPVTKNTDAVAIGLMQIRTGVSATHIADPNGALTASDSIGALASTKFIGNTDWYKLESGFPLIEDYTVPIREGAALECAFKEITPYNLALAQGIDPASNYPDVHSGEIVLGGRTAPDYLRVEGVYTYPDGTSTMTFIFPRAQVSANTDMDFTAEDNAAVTVTFESKNASSDVSGGNAIWDAKPLGRIQWA